MKEELRRVIKDGEFKFYNGTRAENKNKATKLLKMVKENGYENYNIYANSFGYIVKVEC